MTLSGYEITFIVSLSVAVVFGLIFLGSLPLLLRDKWRLRRLSMREASQGLQDIQNKNLMAGLIRLRQENNQLRERLSQSENPEEVRQQMKAFNNELQKLLARMHAEYSMPVSALIGVLQCAQHSLWERVMEEETEEEQIEDDDSEGQAA